MQTLPHLPSAPTPLTFLRDFVSANRPCLISNSLRHWPALRLWSQNSYLIQSLSSPVSIHLTPHGRADSLVPIPPGSGGGKWFASAHVERVGIGEALEMIERSGEGFVAYAQQQNDCFRSEYSALAADCEEEIPWATEAFGGCAPEAVNLWIGNEFSETSFHKDHYENLYAVVTGEKHFLLLPPTDVHRMYIKSYPAAHYSYSKEDGKFSLELDEPAIDVPWCSVNPYPSLEKRDREMAEFPMFFNGPKPFEVTVKAGQILYLPSMWFHHVRQHPDSQGRTIAVNYWYDMQFDIKYAYFNFLQSIRFTSTHNSISQVEVPEDMAESNSKDFLHIKRSIPRLIERSKEYEDF